MSKNETIKPLVMRCMIMRLDERESLAYVTDQGYDISRAQYYRVKKKIKDSRFARNSPNYKSGRQIAIVMIWLVTKRFSTYIIHFMLVRGRGPNRN